MRRNDIKAHILNVLGTLYITQHHQKAWQQITSRKKPQNKTKQTKKQEAEEPRLYSVTLRLYEEAEATETA